MNSQSSYAIARSDLISCVSNIGITAGTHHFVDLWARDSLFATFGADPATAKKTIETFFVYQRSDGLIPYRVRRSAVSLGKYSGKPAYLSSPRPDFRSYQSGGIVPDGGLMTVIASAAYARHSGDTQFLRIHRPQLAKAMQWYEMRFKYNLISEWFLCEWADAVLKVGNTLYTNVLYWKALGDMGMHTQQRAVGNAIRKYFWNGTFFADWIDYRRHDYFASHANMLAIIFGLATEVQANRILAHAKKYCWNGWTLETNYPRYPFWRIPIHNYIVGMGDYHNRGCLWMQPGIVYAIALKKIGKQKEAKGVFDAISKKIVEYNGVYEVYEKSGEPVRRRWYASEHPFAWSAGLYLWAHRDYFAP